VKLYALNTEDTGLYIQT